MIDVATLSVNRRWALSEQLSPDHGAAGAALVNEPQANVTRHDTLRGKAQAAHAVAHA